MSDGSASRTDAMHDAYHRAAHNLPEGSPTHDYLNQSPTGRPMFFEDMSLGEREKAGAKYVQHHNTIEQRNEGMLAKPAWAEKAAAMAPHVKNSDRSLEDASHALGQFVATPSEHKLPTDSSLPGEGWYFDHNEKLRKASPGVDSERLATTSGVMSPLNNPVQERIAVKAVLDAQDNNQSVYVSKSAVRAAKKSESPLVRQTITSGLVGSHQFQDMDPETVRAVVQHKEHVKTTDGRTVRGKHNDTIDLEGMARGGTNVGSGVRGARGEHINQIISPEGGPKVGTYVRSTEGFDYTDKTVREEYHRRATHLANEPNQMDLSEAGQQFKTAFDPHNLTDDSFEVTQRHADHLARNLGANDPASKLQVGSRVKMSELHPAAVQAFGRSDASSAVDQRTHQLSLLSSQHPTVQDSWMNASFANQEHAELPSRSPKGGASAFKRAGSDSWGYWAGKTVHQGGADSSITDDRPGSSKVTVTGIQHATQDFGTRAAAKSLRAKHGMPWDIPSVLVQEGAWTKARRDAGRDDEVLAHEYRNKATSAIDEGRMGDLETFRPGHPVGRQFRARQPQLDFEDHAQPPLFDVEEPTTAQPKPKTRLTPASRRRPAAAPEGLF